jgi:cyclic pyranopterin phosphate synthase
MIGMESLVQTVADRSSVSQARDSFGRTISNLRISVTDRCNFRCRYCMPEDGMIWLRKNELLTFEEITRIAGIFAGIGVTKLRVTGGEPLMRRQLSALIRQLHEIPGIHDIAITTNGYFLPEQAEALVFAGLNRINISMDSLNPKIFSSMVRRDYFEKVRKGLNIVENLGVRPIKLNVVLIRGVNDGEIEQFVDLACRKPFIVRFIEFMPLGADDGWTMEQVVSTREILDRIAAMGGPRLLPVERHGAQPADRYRFEDGKGEIGFISSVSEPFCSYCNRIRITSEGRLRTCLFSHNETDVKSLLRGHATDGQIKEAILAAVWQKEEGHLINRPGFIRPERTMSRIGG